MSQVNHLTSWLYDPGSTTQKFEQRCSQLDVRPGFEGIDTLYQEEALALGVSIDTTLWVREVDILGDGVPWMFARSVFSPSILTGRLAHLAHMNNQPLGKVLFADPHISRTHMDVRAFSSSDPLFAKACRLLPTPPDTLWGRYSVFDIEGAPLFLTEFFLPALMEAEQ